LQWSYLPKQKDFIAEKGYDSQFGARPLHRAIQKYLEDPLAEEILNMHVKAGDTLVAELDKEAQKIKFKLKEEPKKRKKNQKLRFLTLINLNTRLLLAGGYFFINRIFAVVSKLPFACARPATQNYLQSDY
jgi:hypothetical protein